MSFISKDHFSMALKGVRRLIDQISKNIVRPNWNETDENSNAYILNKPFEEREFEYVFVDVNNARPSGQAATVLSSTCEYELIPGNIYKVIINGVEKDVECVVPANDPYRKCLMLDADSSSANKVIYQLINDKSYIFSFTPWYSGTASVKVIGKTRSVKKLDEKFIPDTVVRESDIASTDKYGITKLSNVINQYDSTTAASTYAVTRVYAASLLKSGGTMTGDLTLRGDPTSKLHAATKQYVDNKALLKSGGTMTGNLTLKGDPTSNLHAATKQYVDNTVNSINFPKQVQSDWNQDEDTAIDFIKNKTHYDSKKFLVEQVYTLDDNGYYEERNPSFTLEMGVEYEVIFDDVVYQCIGYDCYGNEEYGAYVGNGSYFNRLGTNEEPFCIWSEEYYDGHVLKIRAEVPGSHKIIIFKGKLKQLDEKFIPDSIARKTDIPAVDLTGLATEQYVDDAIANISGGSGGGTFKTDILINEELLESAAQLSVTLEKDYHKLILIWRCGSNGEERLVDTSGAPTDGILGLLINTNAFSWNSRKVGMINDKKAKWACTSLIIEWTKDLTTFVSSTNIDIQTGAVKEQNTYFGGNSAMIGTLGIDAAAPTKGNTINIVPNTGLFNTGTKFILVGEYIE